MVVYSGLGSLCIPLWQGRQKNEPTRFYDTAQAMLSWRGDALPYVVQVASGLNPNPHYIFEKDRLEQLGRNSFAVLKFPNQHIKFFQKSGD